MLTQLAVAVETHTSWGYYNNATKQEPPANWNITAGEDEFFCKRLFGYIHDTKMPNELYLQGFEKDTNINEKRYIRVASLYPREIDFVRFYEDDTLLDTAFEEPFFLYALTTWEQKPYLKTPSAKEFIAEVHMTNGEVKLLKQQLS